MFNEKNPAFLRGLSLFHGWLPFLLLFLVWRLGYDKRALWAWTGLAWGLCIIAFFLPPAGATLPDPNIPRNVNYVFGTKDTAPQTFMDPHLYHLAFMLGLFAAVALHLENLYLELASVFLMGCHSAVFSPSKYGILPEILPTNKLSWGNGVLELLTFLGIILGTVAGGLLAAHVSHDRFLAGAALSVLAVGGWLTSRMIPKVPAADPTCPIRVNPVTDLIKQLRHMRKDRDLWRANWGNTGFWFVATLVQMNLTIFAKNVLHLSDDQNGYLNAALAIGIGVGSAAAGALSRGRIQYGLVPLGAAGLALSTVPMGFEGISVSSFSLCLVALGLMGGFFIVPIAAVLQYRPTPETRGAVLAAANLVSFVGIFTVSGVQIVLNQILGLTPGEVFWVCGIIALLSGFYAVATRREALRTLVESFKKPVPKSDT